MDKTKGVMTALKGRKGFGSNKGVALLGIVKKLSEKRKEAKGEEKGEVEDKKESKKEEAGEMD